MKALLSFLKTLYTRRETLWALAWRDLKIRYIGSYLGFLWIFIQPAVTVLLLWIIFGVGFRSQPAGDLPFIVWLLAGYFPWLFLSECLVSGTTAIRDNAYLVQKIVFPVSILPVAKILTALIIHIFLLLLLFIMLTAYGYPPTWHALQLPYYLFAAIFLILGATWFSSAVNVFIRDLGQAIGVLVQFAFWATPVFWSAKMLPEKWQLLLNFNPLYYITEGYRYALIHRKWFWEVETTFYFWPVACVIFLAGAYFFKRLRPHFADVL
ncbi:MAG: ABC transporter permease [Leptospiraceae bacterium]|nr:ABC transporter permease [Leptospiraceae bacterium]